MDTHFKKKISKYFPTRSLLIPLLATLLVSCQNEYKETIEPTSYYPLSIGQFSVFDVTEIVYSNGQDSVTNSWQEKDELSKIISDSGETATYLISRSKRKNSADYWQKVKEYTVQKTPDKIVENIDNESIMQLVFPIDLNIRWDAYSYMNLSDNDYRYGYKFTYQNTQEPYVVSKKTFDKTLKVVERMDTSQTQYKVAGKIYAENVGLIKSEQADFQYLQKDGDLVGYKIIGSGRRVTKKIIDYGKN